MHLAIDHGVQQPQGCESENGEWLGSRTWANSNHVSPGRRRGPASRWLHGSGHPGLTADDIRGRY